MFYDLRSVVQSYWWLHQKWTLACSHFWFLMNIRFKKKWKKHFAFLSFVGLVIPQPSWSWFHEPQKRGKPSPFYMKCTNILYSLKLRIPELFFKIQREPIMRWWRSVLRFFCLGSLLSCLNKNIFQSDCKQRILFSLWSGLLVAYYGFTRKVGIQEMIFKIIL